MKSVPRGKHTSAVEVTNVSAHGFWLFIDDREVFLSFKDFPWFRDASIGGYRTFSVRIPITFAGPTWTSTWPWIPLNILNGILW
jgi:hypothetical protein